MENVNLIDTFADFKEHKNIDRQTMMAVLEDVFRNMLIKQYGSDENFDIIINIDKGDFEIWRNRIVVSDEELENENTEISLTQARKFDADYEIDEEFADEVKLEHFGRRSVLSLRQNLTSRILQLERELIFEKYKEKIMYAELDPGDVLLFNMLLMHSSDEVHCDLPRRAYRCSFQSMNKAVFTPRQSPIVVRGGDPERLAVNFPNQKVECNNSILKRGLRKIGRKLLTLAE